MHNIKEIRNNLEFFEKKFKERFENVNLKKLLSLDKENRELIQKKEKLEQEKKIISKTKDKKNFEKSKKISISISSLSKQQEDLKEKIFSIMSKLPNVALDDVPVGKDDVDRLFGKRPQCGCSVRCFKDGVVSERAQRLLGDQARRG